MSADAGPPVLRADPGARRRVLAFALAALLPLAALSAWYPEILHWVTADPAHSIRRLNGLIATLFIPASLMVVACLSLWRTGRASVRARRFPPPGSRVVRDTVIIQGQAAVRRGRQLQWLAGLLIVCALSPPPALWWLLWRFLGPAGGA